VRLQASWVGLICLTVTSTKALIFTYCIAKLNYKFSQPVSESSQYPQELLVFATWDHQWINTEHDTLRCADSVYIYDTELPAGARHVTRVKSYDVIHTSFWGRLRSLFLQKTPDACRPAPRDCKTPYYPSYACQQQNGNDSQ